MDLRSSWRPPYNFAAARPTFVDAWPKAWRALAPETHLVPLSREEIQALGAQIAGCGHWFPAVPATPLRALARRLDEVIARLGGRAFVRLSSRSPKDAPRALLRGLCVHSGAEALALMLSGSVRCAADLRMALDADAEMALVIRRWIDLPPGAEFRCFVQARRWAGAARMPSAADAGPRPVPREVGEQVASLLGGMERWLTASHVADAAIDWALVPGRPDVGGGSEIYLLDINPFLAATDTGLFPDAESFDGSLRIRDSQAGKIYRFPLPIAGAGRETGVNRDSSYFSSALEHSPC